MSGQLQGALILSAIVVVCFAHPSGPWNGTLCLPLHYQANYESIIYQKDHPDKDLYVSYYSGIIVEDFFNKGPNFGCNRTYLSEYEVFGGHAPGGGAPKKNTPTRVAIGFATPTVRVYNIEMHPFTGKAISCTVNKKATHAGCAFGQQCSIRGWKKAYKTQIGLQHDGVDATLFYQPHEPSQPPAIYSQIFGTFTKEGHNGIPLNYRIRHPENFYEAWYGDYGPIDEKLFELPDICDHATEVEESPLLEKQKWARKGW
eukprot:TRINITY_DN94953_c0_g1_i1.p1 TRINITY_DN94953_c0_g1~~TRINITY_DN94953_c0_g1_i1.p1  ORF type:complete len:258 (+),score=30.26 TRINITY_DN94953_c0_g1_i1:47-820(+)